MNEVKVPLIINKLESKAIFDALEEKNMIGLNELYLIQNDNTSEVVDVAFDETNNKLYYTNNNDQNVDIITIPVLKNKLNLSTVATSGSYNNLVNQPSINNITLTGNKTTRDLGISYNDLTNQPTIPQITSTYISSDSTRALNGVALSGALNSYVPNTTTVTGTGAISGGGALNGNVQITHNLAPTGLSTNAVKIGTDTYGHVQLGAAITAGDVNAQSTNYKTITSCANIDAEGYNTILILGTQDETVSFSSAPGFGNKLRLYYANVTDNTINVTVDPTQFQTSTYFFFNGRVLTSSIVYPVAPNSNLCMEIFLMTYNNNGTTQVFTFGDVIQDTGY